MAPQSIPAYARFREQLNDVHNEAAFRYFLTADRRRAERSGRSVVLVLASLRKSPGRNVMLTEDHAMALFCGLSDAIREIDIIGWYRHGYVTAAILAQGASATGGFLQLITDRMVPSLKNRLSRDHARTLRVRIVRLSGRLRN